MATTTGSDISVVLSGGADNLDPEQSIGGDPAVAQVVDNVINNLFSDVSSEDNLNGIEDYRCIYFFNDGETDIFEIKVFILEDFDGGATMEIGVEERDENQRLLITGSPTGGSVTLSYAGIEVDLDYNPDISVMALALQSALNGLVDEDSQSLLSGVVVTGQPTGPTLIFDILFTGNDGSRNHDEMLIVANNLTPSVTVIMTTTLAGSPINTIAPEIGNSTIPPGGVGFFAASEVSPITLPKLKPTEGFPLWIKRVVAANTEAKANDGLTLRFVAESLSV